jgi:HEPN domain-containing protein
MPESASVKDAREWIRRARSDLALAQARPEGVYLEDLCFHAQQAAEKAVKAMLIQHGIPFPYIHDLAALLTLLENATGDLPDSVRQAERLTPFAVEKRYPGAAPPVGEDTYREAV